MLEARVIKRWCSEGVQGGTAPRISQIVWPLHWFIASSMKYVLLRAQVYQEKMRTPSSHICTPALPHLIKMYLTLRTAVESRWFYNMHIVWFCNCCTLAVQLQGSEHVDIVTSDVWHIFVHTLSLTNTSARISWMPGCCETFNTWHPVKHNS